MKLTLGYLPVDPDECYTGAKVTFKESNKDNKVMHLPTHEVKTRGWR